MKISAPVPQRRARIEIVPLIDIIFFLLATFVMLSLSMVKNKGIAVNLPAAETSDSSDRSGDYAAITITAGGDIYFNREQVSPEELTARLDGLKQQEQDPRVVINGDVETELGAAVEIMDRVRKAGISKVAIRTKNPQKSG